MKMYGLYRFSNGLNFTGIVSETETKIIEFAYENFCKENPKALEHYQFDNNYNNAITRFKKNTFDKCYQIHELKII